MYLSNKICSLLSEEVCEMLRLNGIKCVQDFLMEDQELLAAKTGISYRDVRIIAKVLHAQFAAVAISGYDVLNEALTGATVTSTGNQQLDEVLGGGLLSGEFLEFCSSWSSDLTFLCINMAFNAICSSNRHVMYLDCAGVLLPNVIQDYIRRKEKYMSFDCLKNLDIITIENIWQLFSVLEEIGANEAYGSDLLVIDSLPLLIMPLMGGSSSEGMGLLNQLGSIIKNKAALHNMAAVLLNGILKSENDVRPMFGRFWSHVPHTRILIEKLEEKLLKVKVVKSTRLKSREIFINGL